MWPLRRDRNPDLESLLSPINSDDELPVPSITYPRRPRSPFLFSELNRLSPARRRALYLIPSVLLFLYFLINFLFYSPYALSTALRHIPCSVHLQAKCFADIDREWSPTGETEAASFFKESALFREQCISGGSGDWWSAFEERQRKVMMGDASIPLIVWYCDTFSKCHGWGDRLRGIQTTFALALLTDRAFIIKSDRPSPLGLQLRPSSPDLTFEFEDLHPVLRGRASARVRTDNYLWENLDFYEHTNWSKKLKDVTWIHSNVPALEALFLNPSLSSHPLAPILSSIAPESLPGCFDNYLFTPTPRLERAISSLHSSGSRPPSRGPPNSVSLAVQVRVGDQVLEHQSSNGADSVAAEAWRWHEQCLEEVVADIRSSDPEMELQFFVTSDSMIAREHFVDKLQLLGATSSSHSLPAHVNTVESSSNLSLDERVDHAVSSLESTLAEWYMLQRADFIIASRSNFAETAALSSFLSSPSTNSSMPQSGVFIEGASRCSIFRTATPLRLDTWWYWCVGDEVERDSNYKKNASIRRKWCQRWGYGD